MGIWSWLFPTPEQRLEKARVQLERGHHAEARNLAQELDLPEARQVAQEAERALCRRNLDAAVSWARAGDAERVRIHLELAHEMNHGGMDDAFRWAQREIRQIQGARQAEERRKRAEREARLLPEAPPEPPERQVLAAQLPPELLEGPEAEERTARLGLLVESYPPDLQERLPELGSAYAQAVLELEEGRPDLALQGLLALDPTHPLVCWEQARAARALGDPAAAARKLQHFVEYAGGYRRMGNLHSGELLARLLTESGKVNQALRVLREVRHQEPKVGGALFAQLLESKGELAEAEEVLRTTIAQQPKQPALYLMLARVRLSGGHRPEAMHALEQSLEKTCGLPGRCGYVPPDPAVMRMLATLYLEDGIELERAEDLAEQALSQVGAKPTKEDLYLQALLARHRGDPLEAES